MGVYKTTEVDGVVYKTFDEWSMSFYKIRKGSKAIWIEGIPYLSRKQVEKYQTHSTDFDRESDYEQADYYYGLSMWGGCG